MMTQTAWQLQQERMDFFNTNPMGYLSGCLIKNNKIMKTDKMQIFFKSICKDMKEETERIKDLVKEGVIKPLPDKEGIIYDAKTKKKEQM